jgi:hypothetical protein
MVQEVESGGMLLIFGLLYCTVAKLENILQDIIFTGKLCRLSASGRRKIQ